MAGVAPRLTALVATALLTGCGSSPTTPPRTTQRPAAPARTLHVKRARCPSGAANCAAATGRIIYVEAHDPDGDGDLHLVVLGGDVTFRGVTVFDIEKHLRPRRVPRLGDLASAAGPVYRGSYGQRQIQATVLHVAYR
jgi:hypothetical protein